MQGRGLLRRKIAAVATLAVGAGSLVLLHTPANATVQSRSPLIDTRECSTIPSSDFAAIAGAGASFANNLHNGATGLIGKFAAACPPAAAVTYSSTGSGAGQRAARDRTHAWGGSDEPLEDANKTCYEHDFGAAPSGNGCATPPSPGGRNSALHHVPFAAGAVTVFYNPPSACSGIGQLSLTADQIDQIFFNDAAAPKWSDLDASCPATTIGRVVRSDGSGTTWIFKDFIAKRHPRWKAPTDYTSTANNTLWPDEPNNITKSPQNEGVARTVASNPGTIGYVDLATARKCVTGTTLPGGACVATSAKWAKVVNVLGTAVDPSNNGFTTGAPAGANCATDTATTPPSTLSPAWRAVSITDGPSGYPVCGFTYGLVYNDLRRAFNGPIPTNTANFTLAQARTLAFYLAFVVNEGQAFVTADDYAPLPAQVQAVANSGLASLNYI